MLIRQQANTNTKKQYKIKQIVLVNTIPGFLFLSLGVKINNPRQLHNSKIVKMANVSNRFVLFIIKMF